MIKQIISGWIMWWCMENEYLRYDRMKKCNQCDKKKTFIVDYCGECGCILQAKTRCEDCECPLNKW